MNARETEGETMNGHSREPGNIGHTRNKKEDKQNKKHKAIYINMHPMLFLNLNIYVISKFFVEPPTEPKTYIWIVIAVSLVTAVVLIIVCLFCLWRHVTSK